MDTLTRKTHKQNGKIIREARKAKSLKGCELADIIGVSKSHFYQLESGATSAKNHVEALEKELGPLNLTFIPKGRSLQTPSCPKSKKNGDVIRFIRLSKRMSQISTAKSIGISAHLYGDIERGLVPAFKYADKIHEVLGYMPYEDTLKEPDETSSLGYRIKYARSLKLMTQDDLATAIGTTRWHIIKMENDQLSVPLELSEKLQRELDLNLDHDQFARTLSANGLSIGDAARLIGMTESKLQRCLDGQSVWAKEKRNRAIKLFGRIPFRSI